MNAIDHLESDNYYELTHEKAQAAVTFITEKIAPMCLPHSNDPESSRCSYGTYELLIPAWYLKLHGHRLEEKIIEVFPPLHIFARNEKKLKNEMTLIIARMYPNIPKETELVLRKLAGA